jgi:hypothetical protein
MVGRDRRARRSRHCDYEHEQEHEREEDAITCPLFGSRHRHK